MMSLPVFAIEIQALSAINYNYSAKLRDMLFKYKIFNFVAVND